jgi:Tfp pilus assembly protein PilZ
MAYIEKRKYARKLLREKVIYSFGNVFYSGNLRNVSKEGMFVEATYCFPVDDWLILVMKYNDSFLNLRVKVKRLVRNSGSYKGMGLQLMNAQGRYLEYVNSLEAAYSNRY